jgi:hypothetical protein
MGNGWLPPESPAGIEQNMQRTTPDLERFSARRHTRYHLQNEKALPPSGRECLFWLNNKKLNHCYIGSGRAFLTLLDIECNLVAFIERFESGRIDGGMMDKHIRSVFLLNESESFSIIKPLDSTIRHNHILLS